MPRKKDACTTENSTREVSKERSVGPNVEEILRMLVDGPAKTER